MAQVIPIWCERYVMSRQVSGKSSRSPGNFFGGMIEDAVSIGVVGLVVLGVGGLLYKALKPEGWITMALGQLWEKNPGLVWLSGFAVAIVTLGFKHYFDRGEQRTARANLLIYAFLALGLFFFFKLIVTGNL